MSKRIQMRKQRFVALQKILAEKNVRPEPPPWDAHSLSKMSTMSGGRCPPGRSSVSIASYS